jgi:hypothetical protein
VYLPYGPERLKFFRINRAPTVFTDHSIAIPSENSPLVNLDTHHVVLCDPRGGRDRQGVHDIHGSAPFVSSCISRNPDFDRCATNRHPTHVFNPLSGLAFGLLNDWLRLGCPLLIRACSIPASGTPFPHVAE